MTPRRPQTEPHTHTCVLCEEYVIEALYHARRLLLDATPSADGPYVAFLSAGAGWVARDYLPGLPFSGARRHEHDCERRERQLELELEE